MESAAWRRELANKNRKKLLEDLKSESTTAQRIQVTLHCQADVENEQSQRCVASEW